MFSKSRCCGLTSALQRTRHGARVCNPRVPSAGSLSLVVRPLDHAHELKTNSIGRTPRHRSCRDGPRRIHYNTGGHHSAYCRHGSLLGGGHCSVGFVLHTVAALSSARATASHYLDGGGRHWPCCVFAPVGHRPSHTMTTRPNHALQRTRPSHHCGHRGVPRAGSLSLGR